MLYVVFRIISVMNQFRRSRVKQPHPPLDYHINKENLNINIPHQQKQDILEMRRFHHEQLRRKEIEYQKKIKCMETKHQLTIKQLHQSYQNKIKQKQDYISLLEETLRNMQISTQQQIQDLKKSLQLKKEQGKKEPEKKESIKCGIVQSSKESFVTPNITQRLSLFRDKSKSIFQTKDSIESKHKGMPAQKPVYNKQSFLQRKGANMLRLDLN